MNVHGTANVPDLAGGGRVEQGVAFAEWMQSVNTEESRSGEDVVPIPESNTSHMCRHLVQSHVVQ